MAWMATRSASKVDTIYSLVSGIWRTTHLKRGSVPCGVGIAQHDGWAESWSSRPPFETSPRWPASPTMKYHLRPIIKPSTCMNARASVLSLPKPYQRRRRSCYLHMGGETFHEGTANVSPYPSKPRFHCAACVIPAYRQRFELVIFPPAYGCHHPASSVRG